MVSWLEQSHKPLIANFNCRVGTDRRGHADDKFILKGNRMVMNCLRQVIERRKVGGKLLVNWLKCNILCLLQTVCVYCRQFVFTADGLCLLQTVCVYCRRFVFTADGLCLLQTVCVY
jgi:hypothetical protein